jgi:hypothetical protein
MQFDATHNGGLASAGRRNPRYPAPPPVEEASSDSPKDPWERAGPVQNHSDWTAGFVACAREAGIDDETILAHLQDAADAPARGTDMNITTERQPNGEWTAIDDDSYDGPGSPMAPSCSTFDADENDPSEGYVAIITFLGGRVILPWLRVPNTQVCECLLYPIE